MRKQYYFRPSERGHLAWDVDRLIALTNEYPRVQVPLTAIRELDEAFWFDDGIPTWRAVVEHARLIEAADLSFPIVLSAEGRVMDGLHRVAKAVLLGRATVEAVQFPTDPNPDYIGVHPNELPYEDAPSKPTVAEPNAAADRACAFGPGGRMIIGIDHVQITVPGEAVADARAFYCGLLGLREVEKPSALQGRGGFWLQVGDRQVHVGTEEGVARHATKAHVAYAVTDLAGWRARLEAARVEIVDGIPIPGYARFEFRDPFGNRVELIEAVVDPHRASR